MKTANVALKNNLHVTAINDDSWDNSPEAVELDYALINQKYKELVGCFAQESHPFLRMVLGGAVFNQLSYLIETHYPRRIDTVVSELRQLHEIGVKSRAEQGSEVDEAQIERKIKWLAFNTSQLEQVKELFDNLQKSHVELFQRAWCKPGTERKPSASKTSTMGMLEHILQKADAKKLTTSDTTLEGWLADQPKTQAKLRSRPKL